MEYVDGGSLRPAVGTLSLEQIAGVIEGVLAGLAHAERRGVVHRDLKPENLLVTDEGLIKIADFDIAKAIDRTALGESLTATRIDAATGDWTTIDMPTTSKNGYGFAVGDGAVWALDRQHGILYGLDRRTGQPEGDGLQLGGSAIDAVATGGTVDVLMESKTPGRSTPARRCSSTASGFRRGRSGSSSRAPSSSSRSRATASRPTPPDPCAGRSSSTSAGRGTTEAFGNEVWVTVPKTRAIYRFDVRTGDRLGDPRGAELRALRARLGGAAVGRALSLDVPPA